jgi:hypothetical protein
MHYLIKICVIFNVIVLSIKILVIFRGLSNLNFVSLQFSRGFTGVQTCGQTGDNAEGFTGAMRKFQK